MLFTYSGSGEHYAFLLFTCSGSGESTWLAATAQNENRPAASRQPYFQSSLRPGAAGSPDPDALAANKFTECSPDPDALAADLYV